MSYILGLCIVCGVWILGSQVLDWLKTGQWKSDTIADQFHLSPNFVFVDWVMPERLLHWLVFNAELGMILVIGAGLLLVLAEKVEGLLPAHKQITREEQQRADQLIDRIKLGVFGAIAVAVGILWLAGRVK